MKTYPLTSSQLGMFLEWNACPSSIQYTICYVFDLPKSLDADRFEKAVMCVVDKFDVFRMRLVEVDGEVRQHVDPSIEIPFARRSMSVEGADIFESKMPGPFDLFSDPFVRFALIETPAGFRFIIEISHMIADGTSLSLFFADVSRVYAEEPPQAEETPFLEYAESEQFESESANYRAAAEDARERFAGKAMTMPECECKCDAAPQVFIMESAAVPHSLVDGYCRGCGISPNLFFMGAFARTLSLYANEKDAVFFTVNHGRRDPALRTTRGALVRMMPVIGHVDGEAKCSEYFAGFKLHNAGAYPFTHFCRDLGIKPGWGFAYQVGTLNMCLKLEGGSFVARDQMSGGAGEMPTMAIKDDGPDYRFVLYVIPGRYDGDFVSKFVNRCAVVAANFLSLPSNAPLRSVPVLSDAERGDVLELSHGEELAYDKSRTFVDMLADVAAASPSATAVVDGTRSLSYAELDAMSNSLAARLLELGVGSGAFVGLMLPRDASFPVSFAAVQKCGAGYVPMDPEYPADRLAYMLDNSGAGVLLTTHALFNGRQISFAGQVVFFDDLQFDANAPRLNHSTPETPAYMIYTSGSTGRPKGVVLPNRALSAMVAWFVRDFGIGPGKKNLSITSFSFDASVPDLFPTLAAGGELHILSDELRKDLAGLRDYAVKVGATGLTTSTQLGLALVNAFPDLPLEYMMLGGEKMVPFAKTPVRMLNGYGPTEFAVCSSYHEVDQSRSYDIPIGRPVPNTCSFVVDKVGQPVPRGMTGEIALSGPQLADGYWKLPEKTSSVFVESPFRDGDSQTDGFERMYRTGDLAKYNEDGELVFLGRIDFQVKLRGFRIEIGEVEHAASVFPGVGAVAAEVKDVAGSKHLVLYYEGHVDAAELKGSMAKTLTGYMVPDYFVEMAKMPLTPNGKIDRRALPMPQAESEPAVPPANDAEARILPVVASVLNVGEFGVTHDFNRLGLTSLGAMSLLARLKRECGLAVTMKQLADNPTVRQLAALMGAASQAPAPSARRRPRRSTYPMTENQRGIYADWMRSPDALQYNVPAAFKFKGTEPRKLAAAAEKVFAAHPAFMASFVEKDGEMVQARRDDLKIAVPVEEVSGEPDAAFFTSKIKPFRPDADVLSRATVFASPTAAYLFLDIHHAVFDGYSLGVFLGELIRVLGGEEPRGEAYTAFDAALDERDYLESESVADDDNWFAEYLDGAESTSFTTSADGATGKPGEAGRARVRVAGKAISSRLRECGVTASDWFLTAFTELLRRVGRGDDVLVNFVSSGRGNPDTQESVGMFVKTLPLRGVKGCATFEEAVRKMHASVTELIDRDRESFVRLSEKFGVRPEILFAFEGGLFDLPEGVEIVSPETGTVKAPLTVIVTPGKDDFELVIEYDKSKYSERDMSLLAGMFARLSENAATSPRDMSLRQLQLTTPDELAKALAVSRGEPLSYDATETVLDMILANARTTPSATAVVDSEASITYADLAKRSAALAERLSSLGVKPGAFVGLMLPRDVSFPVSFTAAHRCGAGYVPIDADYPSDRIAYILENSAAPVLVTTRPLFAGKGIEFAGEVVYFEDVAEGVADGEGINLCKPELPAYMIYTSGSTGRPKGVVIPHRALRHFCAWMIKSRGLAGGARVAEHASFSFDASVMDLMPTLASGAELHIYCEGLRKDLPGMRDYVVSHGIDMGTMSTQIGMALLDAYPDLPLKSLCVGGEKLMPISRTNVKLINGYGPTEFTVCSSEQVVDQSMEGDIPIGRANPGTWSVVVDRYGQLLPLGFAGELALAGPQIADGYWRLPEKTASVFVQSPDSLVAAAGGGEIFARMYRTGDLVRYNGEGDMMYMGRLDFQVKLRGFRIEIGEIEHKASTFEGIKGVAAEVRDVGGAKHLVLFYGSEGPIDEEALKAHLASSLTDYMVPDYYVGMGRMPLTPNGKIDRRRLPTPSGAAAEAEYVEPANETERKIAETYGRILKLERFGATDDFFASGGTSIIGIKAVVSLQKLGLDVQYGDIFKYKTPRALAAFVNGEVAPNAGANGTPGQAFDYGAYDYMAIDKLLASTPAELFDGFRRHSLGDVLLCGATGYLGIHMLRRLLETTDSTVYALVRQKRGISPERRLDSQYVYYFGERVPRRFRDRLAFIEGDITDGDLGEKLKGLVIGTVFNCAALVKHYIADDMMDRINVGGVGNLVAWCEKTGARFVQTSTYSVGGLVRADSPVMLDERHLFVGQESDNDYVRTKFIAERMVLEAIAAGRIRGKVMRLGNLMGRESDGEFQMNVGANAFVNSLKSYRALGAYPLVELVNRIEMSPIDRVAEAICLLATTPDSMCVFHPYNCYPLDMGAVIGAMNRHGFDMDMVSRGEFASRVDAMRGDPSKSAELQGILHYAGHLLNDKRLTPVLNDWTTTVLYRLGFRWKPSEDGYLSNFLKMLDGLAVFGA